MAVSPAKYARLKELREKKKKLWHDAKAINDKAEAEGRAMRADESGAWEDIMKKVDEFGDRIAALERMADSEEDDDEDRDEDVDDEEDGDEDEDDEEDRDDEEVDEDDEDEDEEDGGNRKRFNRRTKSIVKNGRRYFLKRVRRFNAPGGKLPNRRMPNESQRDYETRKRRSTPEYGQVFNQYLLDGDKALGSRLAQRAIQADSDIVGGYLVAPQEFVAKLIKFVNNYVFIRQKATVYTVNAAQSLGAPSLETDPNDADWTSELDTGNEDTAMSMGKRELVPHPLAKRLRVSNKLLRLATVASGMSADGSVATGGAEALVRDRLGYKFAVASEKSFLLGPGGNQPLGIFTASNLGVDTSRDVTTLNTGTLIGDDLINAKYNQKVQYWPRMEWIFNRSVLSAVRKLKDSYGQYLWVPGGFGGESDKLLDTPVNMSEYAPSVVASGYYVGALFDPTFYWIVDSLELQIQRLVELYAAANQTGFIARMELDGMPVLAEAFTRIIVK